MKIIILGNGFDLVNGLKTSYNDFFNSKKEKIDQYYERIEIVKKSIYPAQDKILDDDIIRSTNSIYSEEVVLEAQNRIKEKIENNIYFAVKKLQEELNKIEVTDVNFWDLYFYEMSKDEGNEVKNWCVIENEIRSCIYNQGKVGNISRSIDNYIENRKRAFFQYNYDERSLYHEAQKFNNNIFQANHDNIIYKTIICKEDGTIYECLLNRLKEFENTFKEYIAEQYRRLFEAEKIRIYYDNFSKLFLHKERSEVYILNFNYTKLDISNYVEDFKVEYKLTESNVHGSFDKSIIFGTDSSEVKSDTSMDRYIFTKTYRKMNDMENIRSVSLPTLDFEYDVELIFFGHSLADADFSYFQSIFDYYDIYNKDIKIIFKYSYYGEKKDHFNQKKKYVDSVAILMEKYGRTFNNKNHGKNLLHKLLLENRLQIENISGSMNKIFFE